MLSMFRGLYSARLSTFIWSGVLATLCAASAAAVPSLECALDDGLAVEPTTIQRRSFQVEQAGFLLVEVQGAVEGTPWFDLEGCGQSSTARVVEHGFDHGVLWVEPGALELSFGTTTAGSTDGLSLSTQWLDRFGTKDGKPGDDTETGTAEIVPFQGAGDWPWPDKDGDEGDDTETGTAEIVPHQGLTGVDLWQGCIDGAEPFDGFALCASPLLPGKAVTGYLESQWLRDRDYYAVTLGQTGHVRLSVSGHIPLSATLLGPDGRPLHRLLWSDASKRAPQEVDLWLPAGEYRVRVEAAEETAGPYRLELH